MKNGGDKECVEYFRGRGNLEEENELRGLWKIRVIGVVKYRMWYLVKRV